MSQTHECRPSEGGTRNTHLNSTATPAASASPALRGFVRDRDPETSWDAAALQMPDRVDARQRAILAALHRYGPMTDEQIIDQLDAMRVFDSSIPASTPQAFRTARSHLHAGGQVIATGERRRTRSGATAIVWSVTADQIA